MTRRGFIESSSAAVAAGLAAKAYAQGNGDIRVGLIGCGGRGAGAVHEALLAGPDVKLVALCDVFRERAVDTRRLLANELPDQVPATEDECFGGIDGYRHVIEASDVVLIACASKFHPMYAGAAVQAGKHVFVEKPHGIDPVGVRRMQAACDLAREKGLSLVSGLQSRFDSAYRETVQRIHDGAIGDIVSIQAMFLRGPYRVMERPEGMDETLYHFYNWYHFRWLSGDDVPQSLVHNMDRVEWLLHEETPEWCFGLAGRSASFGVQYGDMFDHHTVVYTYPSGTQVYALCRTQNGCYGNSSDIVMGSRGICDLGACRITGETNWAYEGQRNNPYQEEQTALIESVRSGEPINSGGHMAHSTMVTVMGQIACYSGGPTAWADIADADLEFSPSPEEATLEMPPPTVPDATGNYPLPMPGITEPGAL